MNESELKNAFANRRPALLALGNWVTKTIVDSLEVQLGSHEDVVKFLQIPPRPRVKEIDSFLEKALVRKRHKNPLEDITDQVGVRFVVLLLEDIECIGGHVRKGPWGWQKDRDFQRERLEKADYFAYQSDHYVVRTIEDREIDGVVIPSGFSCEVQIRTILQHAYAEMAHSSSYKPPIKLPEEDQNHVNRSLAKGSALIETTDDVFREIKKRLREYNESVESLLCRSSELYKEITGEFASPYTVLAEIIADQYRSLLKGITPNDLARWVEGNPQFGRSLKEKRNESVFYRDAIVVLLGVLVTKYETCIPQKWPVDSDYLEDFYRTIGISTSGLF